MKFVPASDLDLVMARRAAVVVDRLKQDVQNEARRRAPAAKRWITRHDPKVRHWHALTNGQTIPANLRYRVQAVTYVRKGRDRHGKAINRAGGWKILEGLYDLGREPRDPKLPIYQTARCRCRSALIPELVALSIHTTVTAIEGKRAVAEVNCFFPRAAESEFGTSEDRPARFMRGAIEEVGRRRLR